MAKQKQKQHYTEVGPFKFCHLNKPDTMYKEEGEFNVTQVFEADSEEFAALKAVFRDAMKQSKEEAEEKFAAAGGKTKAKWKADGITAPQQKMPWAEDYDDEGDPTGEVLVRFKTKATFKTKDGTEQQKTVKLVDGFGEVIPANKRPLVYGGTVGRVAFTVRPYFIPASASYGLTLYLNEVQIVKLVTGKGGSGSSFGAVEGSGFSADDLEEWEEKAKSDDDGDDVDTGDNDLDDNEIPF